MKPIQNLVEGNRGIFEEFLRYYLNLKECLSY